jgi:hypothetical protein
MRSFVAGVMSNECCCCDAHNDDDGAE